ncbi:MAG TPA: LysM peptidoglycan-binding domain-containing protein [Phycisphaerae bacterium]|jgi:5'-nucleotidase
MRWSATLTLLSVGLLGALAVVGCNNAKPKQDMQPAPVPMASEPKSDYFASDPAAGTMTGGAEASGSAYQSPTLASAAPTSGHAAHTTTGGATMHTVAKGETLYSIARKYYNDGKRWKDIAKANNVTADKLRVGQELVIP